MFGRIVKTLCLAAAIGPTSALAQSGTAICYATADTRLEQKAPNTNYGDASRANFDRLWATCSSASSPGNLAEAILKFDLTDASSCNLPAGKIINAARLKVHVGDPTLDRFGFYKVKKAWTERGATWGATGTGVSWQAVGANGTTSPGEDRDAALLASLSNQSTGLKTLPFTAAGRDAVRSWYGTPSSNHGVLFRPYPTDPVTGCNDQVSISSREVAASRPRLEIHWADPDTSGGTFKIVAWNLHYGKGMTTKATGLSCPLSGLKENAQCQIADNPATPLNEQTEERRRSAWGIGLTQRYLNSAMVLGDPEVISLLLTEVNGGTCFTQGDLMAVVRQTWPDAVISRPFRDNWIVARWGFAQGVANYGERDLPRCGSITEGIQWGRIYAEDPDPDGDGVLMANARTVNVFNAHWPLTVFHPDGTKSFCLQNAPVSRDFMNSPAPGINLVSEPRILGGDLNTEDVVRPYEESVCEPYGGRVGFDLMRAAGFADAFDVSATRPVTPTIDGATGMIGRATNESCYRNYSHNGLYMPYKRIDYQWFKGGAGSGRNLRVLSFELISVEQYGNCVPSDHMGTKVQYQWY